MKSERTQAGTRSISWLTMTLILTNVALALPMISALALFGSVGAALSYLSGERLVLDVRSQAFGPLGAGESANLTFNVMNYSERPITILGSRSSCSCVVASDLPKVILPHAWEALSIKFRDSSKFGRISERITLFTDCPGQGQIVLGVTETVAGGRGGDGRAPGETGGLLR